jgi:hypothetical protein
MIGSDLGNHHRILHLPPDVSFQAKFVDIVLQVEVRGISGPVSIQVLEGQVRLHLPERDIEIAAGTLLALEPDLPLI